jgi:hypothetical protein
MIPLSESRLKSEQARKLAWLVAIEMVCFWVKGIFFWCCWGNHESNVLFFHTYSNQLGSFRGLAEEEPGEVLNASRVAPVVFPLETFDVLVFELKEGFSLSAKRLVVGGTAFFSTVL